MSDARIAEFCHEVDRIYAHVILNDPDEEQGSLVSWSQLEEGQRNTITSLVTRLREDPTLQARNIHEIWLRDAESKGWKYGSVFNSDKREDPLVVEFLSLSDAEQVRVEVFVQLVKTLLFR